MSFFDGLVLTYTFYLKIERSDRMILNTEITAKGTSDEIAKAKKNVQRLLTEYTPTFKVPEPTMPGLIMADEISPALTPDQWDALVKKAANTAQQQNGPAEALAPQGTTPTATRKPRRGERATSPLLPGVR